MPSEPVARVCQHELSFLLYYYFILQNEQYLSRSQTSYERTVLLASDDTVVDMRLPKPTQLGMCLERRYRTVSKQRCTGPCKQTLGDILKPPWPTAFAFGSKYRPQRRTELPSSAAAARCRVQYAAVPCQRKQTRYGKNLVFLNDIISFF